MTSYANLSHLISDAGLQLKYRGIEMEGVRWQGVEAPAPMWEVMNYSGSAPIPLSLVELKDFVKPNLPWADIHFKERVEDRDPVNPGQSFKEWPFYKNRPEADKFRTEQEKFTHTYMERIWAPQYIQGIRYKYGNFDDVVNLLDRDPSTRQAFLPVFFPEDTGAVHGGRIPCTLGYHFIYRNNKMHIVYFARSIDYVRHFRDDIYLACRKVFWLLKELRELSSCWINATPGTFTFHLTSLHCFTPDLKNI